MKTEISVPGIIVWTIDDSQRDMITGLLMDEGVKITNVYNMHELFAVLEDQDQDLIIFNEDIPRLMNYELCELIKKIERFEDMKLIMISSSGMVNTTADECIEESSLHDLLVSKVKSFLPEEYRVSESERRMHEEARRFAKIIVSDIVLYNKEKAELGVREGTLQQILRDEIEEGRTFYSSRIPSEILATTNYFDEAIDNYIQAQCSV